MTLKILKKYSGGIGLLVSVMLAWGCATLDRNKNDLHRLNDVRALPKMPVSASLLSPPAAGAIWIS